MPYIIIFIVLGYIAKELLSLAYNSKLSKNVPTEMCNGENNVNETIFEFQDIIDEDENK